MYYDGTKLLSLMDINGNQPEIYICSGNRSSGKTTYFNRWCVNRFKKYHEKFCILYRYTYEISNVPDKFFKDIGKLFFTGDVMTSKKMGKGTFDVLYLNEIECGYAIAINSADQIKKYSHMFSDVGVMVMDEFQSETNHYCSDEIKKLISIHTSVARGNGSQIRRVPLILLSNSVSILNPYYVELGIADRLNKDTKYLKGDGYVLEQSWIESASIAQKASGFNRAFAKNEYVAYASENVYLNDNSAFIDSPDGQSRYICTIKYGGVMYGIREYANYGIIYATDKCDPSFKLKIVVDTGDHDVNFVMLKKNDFLISNLRWYFERGCFRFKNLKCKSAVLQALAYR